MADRTETYSTTLKVISCGVCGIPFAWPESLDTRAREEGRSLYCPNGDRISYKTTEMQRLREELRAKEDRLQRVARERDSAERRRRAAKAHATRLRNRIARGKCPACSEQFDDVAEHVRTAHPDMV